MQVPVTHWHEHQAQIRDEQVTVEEPLEVRLNSRTIAVIMRTPGADFELALGFLLSEGILQATQQIHSITYAVDADGVPLINVVNVQVVQFQPDREPDEQGKLSMTFERHFAVSSSCGLCGKNSITDVLRVAAPLESDEIRLSVSLLYSLADQLRSQQKVFQYTGGLHAAGLFNLRGELQLLREDVGRHNAIDKLVGYGLQHALLPYREHILLVSGRTSFEIVQKALLARIPCVIAISAPSSLAVELAQQGGITLIGFLRNSSMNIYTHSERVT